MEGEDMAEIIQFPKSMIGKRVVLFTENRMYIGTLKEQFDLVSDLSVRLENAAVAPIEAVPPAQSTISLPEVLVLWSRVVAVAPAEQFQINFPETQSAPQEFL